VHLPAPTYIDYVMTWVQNMLDDDNVFPTKSGECLILLSLMGSLRVGAVNKRAHDKSARRPALLVVALVLVQVSTRPPVASLSQRCIRFRCRFDLPSPTLPFCMRLVLAACGRCLFAGRIW
jgi:hypothetical protein